MNSFPLGHDKHSEYTFKTVESYGVVVSSRHNKIHELAKMLEIVDKIPEELRHHTHEIWTDSNVSNALRIETERGLSSEIMRKIGECTGRLYCASGADWIDIQVSNGEIEIDCSRGYDE